MTETPLLIPWAPGAQYTKVICRLGEPRPDGSDVDEYPDLMTQGGTVTITCAAKKIRYSESDGRARMLTTRPWTFKIRPSDGELYNPESGAVGVHVLSGNSTGVDPAGFTWSATVTPDNGESWTVTIPANAGATVDLVSIVDIVAPSAGESTLSARVSALEASYGGGGLDTESVQDIVGSMIAGAGGTYNDADGTVTLPSGGGGGAVSSVAGRTGIVVLSSADLTDVASLATDAELSSGLATKADVVHEHTSGNIADWAEAVQDTVAEMLTSGANVTLTYDDAAGKVTVTASGGDAELMRDTIGAALVGVGGVSVAVNDAADTITLSISGVTSTQISDFTEATQDVVGAMVAAAGGSYNDASGAITLPSGGGASSTPHPRTMTRWGSPYFGGAGYGWSTNGMSVSGSQSGSPEVFTLSTAASVGDSAALSTGYGHYFGADPTYRARLTAKLGTPSATGSQFWFGFTFGDLDMPNNRFYSGAYGFGFTCAIRGDRDLSANYQVVYGRDSTTVIDTGVPLDGAAHEFDAESTATSIILRIDGAVVHTYTGVREYTATPSATLVSKVASTATLAIFGATASCIVGGI